MKLRNIKPNEITVEITGADISGFLSALSAKNIPIHNITWKDSLSVTATFSSMHEEYILKKAEKSGTTVKKTHIAPITSYFLQLRSRPLLIFGIALILILTLFLPTRILQVEVTGNHSVADKYIIEAVAQCGVSFGAKRNEIRSEVVKNKLLEMLPQLQWAGVNTYGCRAVISVQEKSSEPKENSKWIISSLVASNDGIISSITATKGNALCSVGQAVKKGQVLISGYWDCGNKIQATKAEGEIFAYTKRDLSVIIPNEFDQKVSNTSNSKNISIIFGKYRINLFQDSGIYTTGCDKMYKEYPIVLPGGFVLPITLAVEYQKGYNETESSLSASNEFENPSVIAQNYLLQQMISGKIISKTEKIEQTSSQIQLRGVYHCLEMIGRTRTEEILNGKDR